MQGLDQVISDRRILRLPEVEKRAGFKRTKIYSLMKEGKFPKRIKLLGGHYSGWDSFEIDRWVEDQLTQEKQ